MTPKPPAIILLNFNGLEDTLECLDSLRAAELGGAPVILVDNGSEPASVQGLLAWNDRTAFFGVVARTQVQRKVEEQGWSGEAPGPGQHVLLLNEDNLGFAGGCNLGTRLALAQGATDVLLLNNDTTVAPDFLEQLYQARRQFPGAVLIPQIRLYHQPDRLWNCGGQLRWPGRKKYLLEGAPVAALPATEFLPVTFVTGCALWYTPALTGLLTERFFFGEEDMEFSLRLRRLGIPAWCVTGSVVYHKVGSTLTDNHRKSEIFTLKRLVNLRQHTAALTWLCAAAYYLANLFRLLTGRYGLSWRVAGETVTRVWRRSRQLDGVGEEWCVAYVRNGN